jgi:hypothetical protein
MMKQGDEGIVLEGIFRWELWSKPNYSHFLRGPISIMLQRGSFKNGIITLSINDLLNTYFRNGTPNAAWYIGLIDSTGFTELDAADAMNSHAGWTELTDYSESTRPAWGAGAAASGVITNAAAVAFTASSDITVQGLFVTSNSTKSGTTGTLWNTGSFASTKDISTGQQLKAFYELRARQG